MKSDAQQFLCLLFLSRDAAHIAHLNTTSFAQHMALGEFYDSIIDLADKFSEAYMGRTGQRIGSLPNLSNPKGDIVAVLKLHMDAIEETRDFVPADDSPLNNIIDEIVGLYLATLYKLTLK
jgi:hypothetical protein